MTTLKCSKKGCHFKCRSIAAMGEHYRKKHAKKQRKTTVKAAAKTRKSANKIVKSVPKGAMCGDGIDYYRRRS